MKYEQKQRQAIGSTQSVRNFGSTSKHMRHNSCEQQRRYEGTGSIEDTESEKENKTRIQGSAYVAFFCMAGASVSMPRSPRPICRMSKYWRVLLCCKT